MLAFIIVIIILVSLMALALVIRDVGREMKGMDEANRGDAEDAEGDAKNQQKAMAERKLAREIQKRRDGK